MDRRKIVIVGAGSAMFTQGLVADMIVSGQPWQLGLVDVDPRALATAEGLARRMVEARQVDITVEASTDRCDLLAGAGVVVSTIGVGGRKAWLADVVIPRKYGVYQPVGDSVMAGGISRALRMVPAMVDIARDLLRLAPGARFFNYANPMTANCWAVRKATGADLVGLCIGVYHVVHQLASFIDAPKDKVSALACGLNHFTWVWDLRWDGRDAWPLVREKLARERARLAQTGDAPEDRAPGGDTTLLDEDEAARTFVAGNPLSWSLFEAYGAYPAVNDRHVIEFFPERFPQGSYHGNVLGVSAFSVEEIIAHGDRIYEEMRAQAAGEVPLDNRVFERAAGEHSQLLDILRSLDEDRRESYTANLPNRGAVPNLPADAVLELTCVATGRGLRPIAMPDFPDLLAAPLTRKIAAQALTVEAALTGSRKLFVEAILADGSVAEPAVAGSLADELLREQREYLPQFA
jgi:alpha-galactosidase